MNCAEFVNAFVEEKKWQMADYFSSTPGTVTGTKIKELSLTDDQLEILKEAFDACLIDTYYTTLLGLDGSTGIGPMQHTFKIYDEDKNLLSYCGEIESEAYERFHGEGQ